MSNSPTLVQARLKLGNQQRKTKAFCDRTGLVRRPENEKAYGIGKQPRALKVNPFERKPISFISLSGHEEHSFVLGIGNGRSSTIRQEANVYTLKSGQKLIMSQTLTDEYRDEIVKQFRKLPKELKKDITMIEAVDFDNPADPYWRKKYKDFDKSAATGGNGKITLYECSSQKKGGNLLEILAHESGHNYYDAEIKQSGKLNEWNRALSDDYRLTKLQHVSEYGSNSYSEEFAESVKWLVLLKNGGSHTFNVGGKVLEVDEAFRSRYELLRRWLKYGG